jgi:site-specific DNA-methyltransferase (adenine-specific)
MEKSAMTLYQQIWNGDSRVFCEKFKPGRVNCIITDPPFGVDNLSNQAVTPDGKRYARKIANDTSVEQAIRIFNEVAYVLLPKTSDNCDLYVFTASEVLCEWIDYLDTLSSHGFKRKAILVWEKEGPGMGDLDSWGQGHEFIIYLKKGNRTLSGPRRNGVLHVPQVRPANLIHPHEKPEALYEMLIKASTNKGDLIVDPFGGSGVLARAARNTERSGIAIELDADNYGLALRRFDQVDLFS